MRVYLALGSNLGDREANLREAVRRLDEALGVSHSRLSSFYDNPAQGFVGKAFLNAVVRYDFPFTEAVFGGKEEFALALLEVCKRIEREMGRTVEGIRLDGEGKRIYADRIIDIDILLIDTWHISLPQLTIPHPRMQERDFVMIPLKEIFE